MAFEFVVLRPKVPRHQKRRMLIRTVFTLSLVEEDLVHCLGCFTFAVETVSTPTLLLESMDIFPDVLFGVVVSTERGIWCYQSNLLGSIKWIPNDHVGVLLFWRTGVQSLEILTKARVPRRLFFGCLPILFQNDDIRHTRLRWSMTRYDHGSCGWYE